MTQWHGGKGSSRRKGEDDDKYRNNYDRIFGKRENCQNEEHSNQTGSDISAPEGNTDSDLPKTGR